VEALEPAAEILWQAPIGPPLFAELAAAPGGIAYLESAAGGGAALVLLAPFSGREVRRLALPSVASSPPAADSRGIYLALEDGTALRYSTGTERISWRVPLDLPPGAEQRTAVVWAVSDAGVIAASRHHAVLLREPRDGTGPVWGHWRAGPGRSGTADGDSAPLEGRVLWRARPGRARAAPLCHREVLPLERGWLLAAEARGEHFLEWVSDSGAPLASTGASGPVCCLVRSRDVVCVATGWRQEGHGRGQAQGEGGETAGKIEAFLADCAAAGECRLRPLWQRGLDSAPGGDGALAAAGGRLVAATRSALEALAVEDGEVLWERRDLPGAVSPVVAGRRLYAGLGTEVLVLDIERGRTLRRLDSGGGRIATLSYDAGRLFLAVALAGGPGEGSPGAYGVRSLEESSGGVLWTFPLELPVMSALSVSEEAVAVNTAAATFLLGLDGKPLGTWPAPELVGAPLVATGVVFVASAAGLAGYDSALGELVWKWPAEDRDPGVRPSGSPALARGRIVFPAGAQVLCLGEE
jgi:hypothetical protein